MHPLSIIPGRDAPPVYNPRTWWGAINCGWQFLCDIGTLVIIICIYRQGKIFTGNSYNAWFHLDHTGWFHKYNVRLWRGDCKEVSLTASDCLCSHQRTCVIMCNYLPWFKNIGQAVGKEVIQGLTGRVQAKPFIPCTVSEYHHQISQMKGLKYLLSVNASTAIIYTSH